MKKERFETLKTARAQVPSKEIGAKIENQFRMSGEEKQETRLEGKKTSDQEGSSARLKGLGVVLRAWGEEPPSHGVKGALAWGRSRIRESSTEAATVSS